MTHGAPINLTFGDVAATELNEPARPTFVSLVSSAGTMQAELLADRPAPPPTPHLVSELERCFDQVHAAEVPAATLLEFQARRFLDKSVRTLFETLPRLDEKSELVAFIWMKANSFAAISPSQLSAALVYVSHFRKKIFFSEPHIPILQALAANDERALDRFCQIMNACPDLDADSVYRSVGRQMKLYLNHESISLSQLFREFNERGVMGSFEVFSLEEGRVRGPKGGGVGFLRRERARQLRAEGRLDSMTFRKLQARLHFEDRPEILHILAQSSAYAPFVAIFASAYIDGYESETMELAHRLTAILVRRK